MTQKLIEEIDLQIKTGDNALSRAGAGEADFPSSPPKATGWKPMKNRSLN
jgi:hypothetical protein